MTALAVVLVSQILDLLKCGGGLALTCLHAQDGLLILTLSLSIALAAAELFSGAIGRVHGAVTIGWAILFTWYSWFSFESPFRLHEWHTPGSYTAASTTEIVASYGLRLCFFFALTSLGAYPLLSEHLKISHRAER
jgi:hypothetical protein